MSITEAVDTPRSGTVPAGPDSPPAWTARGVAAAARSHWAEAAACHRKAVALSPRDPATWSNLGRALTELNRQALALPAARAPAWLNLGHAVKDLRSFQSAVACHREAAALAPSDATVVHHSVVALKALGIALRANGQLRPAVACYHEALNANPGDAAAWSNLGNVLKDLKQLDSALYCHRRALDLAPDALILRFNSAVALAAANRPADAIGVLDEALKLRPGDPHLRWDRALNHLRLGDYRRGWLDYEARLETGMLPPRTLPGRRWAGTPYPGERLLIASEQGFGDALWTARYYARAKALGGELIVECRAALIPLLARMNVADRLVAKGDVLPEAEWHLEACSLPGLFSPAIDAVDGAPYLRVPADRAAPIRAAMRHRDTCLQVGIVWSGSTTFEGNGDRAVPLGRFLDAFALPGVQLYSLQKGEPESELRARKNAPVIDLAPLLRDFADTAAAIGELDLVIMTDSAVAHLAGALGKPVRVLLNHVPYWLWLMGRDDSPWYRSVRLFRAEDWDGWTRVFDCAAAELMHLVHATETGRAGRGRAGPPRPAHTLGRGPGKIPREHP